MGYQTKCITRINLICDVCGHGEEYDDRAQASRSGWRELQWGSFNSWKSIVLCPWHTNPESIENQLNRLEAEIRPTK